MEAILDGWQLEGLRLKDLLEGLPVRCEGRGDDLCARSGPNN
jgi:hypothetical protein